MAYVDFDYYKQNGGTVLTEETAAKALERASDTVDVLTYNRIVKRGFDALTAYQQAIVQKVCCGLADWQTENADMLDSALSAYSINGVTVNYAAGAGVETVNGETVPGSLLSRLRTTGLCFAGVR